MARYTLTVRAGGRVRRERFGDLDGALAALERHGRTFQDRSAADSIGGALVRRIEPEHQVTARVEVAGPGRLRAGLDVRGDGSALAYTGRLRRTPVEGRPPESAYDALRRALGD